MIQTENHQYLQKNNDIRRNMSYDSTIRIYDILMLFGENPKNQCWRGITKTLIPRGYEKSTKRLT